jgi:membrane associated rhomboid family serine protease
MNEASVGHQCPECIREGRKSVRPVRTAFGGSKAGGAAIVTKVLIALNLIAAIITALAAGRAALAGGVSGQATLVHDWGAIHGQPFLYPKPDGTTGFYDGVVGGEFYRLLTSMFLHYGPLHLILNMAGLWIFGRPLEAAFGPLRFLALYMLAGLGGSVSVYVFDYHTNSLTAGASGAIYGLVGAYFVVLKRLKLDTSAVVPYLIFLILYSFIGNVSLSGHLGGLVFGSAVAAGLAYPPQKLRTPLQIATTAGTFLILLVITAVWTIVHS